jgi:hypothetical protein
MRHESCRMAIRAIWSCGQTRLRESGHLPTRELHLFPNFTKARLTLLVRRASWTRGACAARLAEPLKQWVVPLTAVRSTFGSMTARRIAQVGFPCFLALMCVILQGCLVWRYTTTPVVTGTVVEAGTGRPISGARVGFREHNRIEARTNADGSFHLYSDHAWEGAVILPFEFTLCGGKFFIEAPGYATFEQDIGPRRYPPFIFPEPIALRKQPEQSAPSHVAEPPSHASSP